MQTWKIAMRFPASFMSADKTLKYVHNYVRKTFGQYLLTKAFQARVGTTEAEEYIRTLEDTCVNVDNIVKNPPEYSTLPLQNIVLGVWRKYTADHEKGDAVICPFFSELTTNGTYSDDEMGTGMMKYMLAKILIAYGDDERARSVLHTYAIPGQPALICQGRCRATLERWIQGYVCRLCSMDLCEGCGSLLGQCTPLPINVCSAEHSWVHVRDPILVSVPEAQKKDEIRFKGEIVPKAQFYSDLREEYGL